MDTLITTNPKPKDPVCGMIVDSKSAVGSIHHKGQAYSFCSERCLEKFRSHPSAYVKPLDTKQQSSQHGVSNREGYTCPMHPRVHQAIPGNCPKCGMALESVT